jgi:hypothetical protein
MLRRYTKQETEAAMAFLREDRMDIYKTIIFNEIVRGNQEDTPVSDLYAAMRKGEFVHDNTTDITSLLLDIRKMIHANIDRFKK